MGVSTSYTKAEIEIKEVKLKKLFASGIHEKPLKITDPVPTEHGGYVLQDVGNYSFGTTLPKKWNVGFLSASGWEIVSIDIADITGKVEPNNINAVSGAEIYKSLVTGEKITTYNTWTAGYYFNDGDASTGTTYSMQRTPKSLLKKGETLKFGVNTFNTAGGSSAIFNIYNLDGTFKANILKQNDFLNQFKQYEYTATEDVLYTLVDFSTANFGTKYIEIHSVNKATLNPLDSRVTTIETSQSEIFNGTTSLLPEQSIPIDLDSYYYYNTGGIGGNGSGHLRTNKIWLKKGRTVNYGVNVFTSVGSIGILNIYNLDGTFLANIKRPETAILGTFYTGSYTAQQDVLFAISDYKNGNYGTSYVTIVAQEGPNYKKGLNFLLETDSEKVSKSNFEASQIYSRGRAIQYFNDPAEITVLVGGQSNAEGRNPKENFPASYLNANGEVIGVKIWNDQTKTFAPFKFGVNTGSGKPNTTTTSNMYAFDVIAAYLLSQYKGKTVNIIKRAQGGTAISTKGSDGGGYWTVYTENIPAGKDKLIEEFKIKILNALAANPNLVIKACLWHQGEGDSNYAAAVEFYQGFKNDIAFIRGVVGNPRLPFIFGTIAPGSQQYSPIVNAAFNKVFAEDKFTYLIDMSDGALFDPYHFDPASTALLGQRMFNVLKDL